MPDEVPITDDSNHDGRAMKARGAGPEKPDDLWCLAYRPERREERGRQAGHQQLEEQNGEPSACLHGFRGREGEWQGDEATIQRSCDSTILFTP
jgi:hypothetical protein